MKNKVLINLIVPSIMGEFEIFIPVNERISKIKELILTSLKELSDNDLDPTKKYSLIDPETGNKYDNESIVRDLNIYNAKRLILYSF